MASKELPSDNHGQFCIQGTEMGREVPARPLGRGVGKTQVVQEPTPPGQRMKLVSGMKTSQPPPGLQPSDLPDWHPIGEPHLDCFHDHLKGLSGGPSNLLPQLNKLTAN